MVLFLDDGPFPLEELEIAVDHGEGDLPPARAQSLSLAVGGGQELHVPLVAVDGALGVELEAKRQILLADLNVDLLWILFYILQFFSNGDGMESQQGKVGSQANLVDAREAVGLVEQAALGETGDEVGEALVVGERGPDGLQRRVDAHPGAHHPAVPPPHLGDLDLEADGVVPVVGERRRIGRGEGSPREPRGRCYCYYC